MSIKVIMIKRDDLEQAMAFRKKGTELIYNGDTYVFDSSFTKDLVEDAKQLCRTALMHCIPSLIVEDKYEFVVWKALAKPTKKTPQPKIKQDEAGIDATRKTQKVHYRGVEIDVPVTPNTPTQNSSKAKTKKTIHYRGVTQEVEEVLSTESPKRTLIYRGQRIS